MHFVEACEDCEVALEFGKLDEYQVLRSDG